jgi:hypothetical protein
MPPNSSELYLFGIASTPKAAAPLANLPLVEFDDQPKPDVRPPLP